MLIIFKVNSFQEAKIKRKTNKEASLWLVIIWNKLRQKAISRATAHNLRQQVVPGANILRIIAFLAWRFIQFCKAVWEAPWR